MHPNDQLTPPEPPAHDSLRQAMAAERLRQSRQKRIAPGGVVLLGYEIRLDAADTATRLITTKKINYFSRFTDAWAIIRPAHDRRPTNHDLTTRLRHGTTEYLFHQGIKTRL